MQIKTGNKIDVHNKSKVMFISHPDDFSRLFEVLSDEIISTKDCAIYYYNMDSDIQEQELQSALSEMNLIVIPITDKFLSEHSIAMDAYFFSQSQNIPVLPIAVEKGLDKKFNSVCGEKQFLDRTDDNPTSVPYSKKLAAYLSFVLIGDELTQKVRAAFDAYVFLSYRKKDRKQAQKLMHTIHSNDFAQSVAIWYDEFLQPNENFNDSIKKALLKSDLFALVVTPNLINEKNYVLSEEYPAAIEAQKCILPVEAIETDKGKLYDRFPNLPDCFSMNDPDALTDALIKSLSHIAKQPVQKTPEHNYYIGLAYLHGIDVEINKSKAIELLRCSAEAGFSDAVKELVKMYYYGYLAGMDYAQASLWQKKLVELLQKEYNDNPSYTNALDYADALRFYTEVERNVSENNSNTEMLLEKCKKSVDICNHLLSEIKNKNISSEEIISRTIECKLESSRSMGILYEISGDYDKASIEYMSAIALQKEITELDTANIPELTLVSDNWRMARLHNDFGEMYVSQGDYESALSEFEEYIARIGELAKIEPKFSMKLINGYTKAAKAASYVDLEKANSFSKKSLDMIKSIPENDFPDYDLDYAGVLFESAVIQSKGEHTDFGKIESMYLTAKNIYEKHLPENAVSVLISYMNILYKLACFYHQCNNEEETLSYFEKSIAAANRVCDLFTISDEIKRTIAHLRYDYGCVLVKNVSNEEYLLKAKELFALALSYYKTDKEKYCTEISCIKNYYSLIGKNTQTRFNEYSDDESKESDDIQNEKLMWFMLNVGIEKENDCDYREALFYYKMAEQKLEELGFENHIMSSDYTGVMQKNDIDLENYQMTADLFDRIAYCLSEIGEISESEKYYKKALSVAENAATASLKQEDVKLAITFHQKLIMFYDDFNDTEGKIKAQNQYEDFKKRMIEYDKEQSNDEEKSGDEETVMLPNKNGKLVPCCFVGTVPDNKCKYIVFLQKEAEEISLDAVLILAVSQNRMGEENCSAVDNDLKKRKILKRLMSE